MSSVNYVYDMASVDSFIDIGDEVISFAHEQGHTKANKNTINWRGLKSASGAAKFATTSKTIGSKAFETAKDSKTVFDYLRVLASGQTNGQKFEINANNSSDDEIKKHGEKTDNNVKFDKNYLVNEAQTPIECNLTINSSLKNTATAEARLVSTLSSAKKLKSTKISKNHNKVRTRHNQSAEDDELLKKVPLTPKFCIRLNPASATRQNIPCKSRPVDHKAIALPQRTESRIEIVEHKEEEKGSFKVDYYLWGSVEVTVWGKPYTLMVTDILDNKNNPLFTR